MQECLDFEAQTFMPGRMSQGIFSHETIGFLMYVHREKREISDEFATYVTFIFQNIYQLKRIIF
jgi:hypothetical protein